MCFANQNQTSHTQRLAFLPRPISQKKSYTIKMTKKRNVALKNDYFYKSFVVFFFLLYFWLCQITFFFSVAATIFFSYLPFIFSFTTSICHINVVSFTSTLNMAKCCILFSFIYILCLFIEYYLLTMQKIK